MSTLDLEKSIVQRITAALTLSGQQYPKVDVLAWPNKPREYKMTHPHGCVMVIYKGSKFTSDKSIGGHFVERAAHFELGILSRTLREANVPDATSAGRGIYELLDSCRTVLLGWQPGLASNVIELRAEEFDDYVEGTWGYSLKFAVPMVTLSARGCPSMPLADPAQLVTRVDLVGP